MIQMFSLALVGAFLTLPAPQDAGAPAQSVADAARAARERRNASNPKRVLTDDDLSLSRNAADPAAVNEEQVRATLEKSYPQNPTVADLKTQLDQIAGDSKNSPQELTAKFKQAALYGYESVDFPGRQEWEEQLESATTHFVGEAASASARLQTLLDENRNTFSRPDAAAAIQRMRAQWIDIVVPYASWQTRSQQLMAEGQSRARAYKADSSTALREYRRGRAAQAESAIGLTLISLRQEEEEFHRNRGRYTCDLSDFSFNTTNPNKLQNSKTGWDRKMDALRNLGYSLVLQGCDADHFTAIATPPAPDGGQGRAFCSSESGIRIAADGSTDNCLTTGRDWRAQ
jgi:hypothetical protein